MRKYVFDIRISTYIYYVCTYNVTTYNLKVFGEMFLRLKISALLSRSNTKTSKTFLDMRKRILLYER